MIKDDEISIEFLCPISQQIMQDPVLAGDGVTYERESIQAYFAKSKPGNGEWRSPVKGFDIDNRLVSNDFMKSSIQKFLKKNSHLQSEVYFQEALIGQTVAAVKEQNDKTLQQLVEKEPRLWSKLLIDDKTLVTLVCEQGNKGLLLWLLKQLKVQQTLLDNALKNIDSLLLVSVRNVQLGSEGIKYWFELLGWQGETLHQQIKTWLETNQCELIQAIIDAKLIDINARLDKDANTMLHLAAHYKHRVLIKWLMDKGAEPKCTNVQERRPEHLAEQAGDAELTQQIIQWRQAKKQAIILAPFITEMEKLKREFKEKLITSEHQLKILSDQVKTLGDENRKLSQRIDNINPTTSNELLKSNTLFAHTMRQLLKPAQQKQDEFIAMLLQGRLFKAEQLYKEGGVSLIAPDKNGLFPLVAAAYSTNIHLLQYIEEKLGKDADQFWSMIDTEKLQQQIKTNTPVNPPQQAKAKWIVDLLVESYDKFWWARNDDAYISYFPYGTFWFDSLDCLKEAQKILEGAKRLCTSDSWSLGVEKLDDFSKQKSIHLWDNDALWKEALCRTWEEQEKKLQTGFWFNQDKKQQNVLKMGGQIVPSRNKYEEAVKAITDKLKAHQDYCLDKIKQAKNPVVQPAIKLGQS